MKLDRRKLGAAFLVIAGIVALAVPFFFSYQTQSLTAPPPPTGGNDNGGKNSSGGTTPPCTTNCAGAGSTDTQPPTTTLQATGQIEWSRNGISYFYPNITIILHATDDENLSKITLNDTGKVREFSAHGPTLNATVSITAAGLHTLSYYATDDPGNKEITHHTALGISKPDLSDLQNIITNSNIDNPGIENAMLAKINTAQAQLAAGQKPNALNALSNQLNALSGKHGLDQATVDLLQSMIQAMIGKARG